MEKKTLAKQWKVELFEKVISLKRRSGEVGWLIGWLVGWLVGFYGISNFVGYLTPNPFYENSSISNNSVYDEYAV